MRGGQQWRARLGTRAVHPDRAASIGGQGASRVAAARTLGATPWRAFWRIEWPAILPWLMSALCLVFLY